MLVPFLSLNAYEVSNKTKKALKGTVYATIFDQDGDP